MNLVKYAGISLIAMSASMGHAGGMEATALSAGFMFEDGNYGAASLQSQTPSLKATVGGAAATSKSVVGGVTSTNISAKMDVLDNISIGISYYRQAGIKLDYQGSWTLGGAPAAAALPKVDLDVTALVALAKYGVNDNFSVLAGIKNGTAADATILIPNAIAAQSVSAAVAGGSAMSYVAGVAYEIPEIALRAELIYETKAEFTLETKFSGVLDKQTKASTPVYINAYVQSGVAEDTLAFVSVRQADWASNQVSINPSGTYANISSFTDSTTYEIGVGRKFGDTWSSSIAYNWEGKSAATTASPLTLNNGRQGISIGAKYSLNENTAISFGGNYTMFGDVEGTWAAGTFGANAKFSGNTATTLGANISHSF